MCGEGQSANIDSEDEVDFDSDEERDIILRSEVDVQVELKWNFCVDIKNPDHPPGVKSNVKNLPAHADEYTPLKFFLLLFPLSIVNIIMQGRNEQIR